MKFLATILTALILAGITNAIASPTLIKEKRATIGCNCSDNIKKLKIRDSNVAVAEPALLPAVIPSVDTKSTPDPSKDGCLKQLEQYGAYADPRCMGYGAPLELIDHYRGGKVADKKAVVGASQ
ncbi:hypothetical protein TWF225_006559 [Orbilia oligospora]|nr:hypothetical protein TWF225_006559 [Orbilia oligospora]KAF3265074.1 hypothetical protein TWF217_002723 [Orbilia oligospora]KAF3268055.1 hypothetical protein TWF128_008069 [Orbilia oligospora]KAF3290080.1 hypothetical protein TWF132_007277 [Orbilia oligospora]